MNKEQMKELVLEKMMDIFETYEANGGQNESEFGEEYLSMVIIKKCNEVWLHFNNDPEQNGFIEHSKIIGKEG